MAAAQFIDLGDRLVNLAAIAYVEKATEEAQARVFLIAGSEIRLTDVQAEALLRELPSSLTGD